MFVGHTACALAAKSLRRDVPLGTYLIATFALDLIWPVLLLAGVETVSILPGATLFTPLVFTSYPWSHSLLMAAVWGLAGWALARGRGAGAAWLVAALVVSHWLLDVVTHAADLPLWPGRSPLLGLGLWNSFPATYLVEGALYAGGIALYLRATRPRDLVGRFALGGFLIFSGVMWAVLPWLAPPPGPRALAVGSFSVWLLILWGAWADRHRDPVEHAAH